MGFDLSAATGFGFIAVAGVSADFGVIMIIYLKHAREQRCAAGRTEGEDLMEAVEEGAVLRVRPKAMTVAVIVRGLLPILVGSGTAAAPSRVSANHR